jgi:flagellar hook-associated protein 3
MRIAHKTIYDTARYQLGQLTVGLNETNKVVSSGKRINRLSDDPVGLAKVLDLKSNLNFLGQVRRNLDTGRNWLRAGETSLMSVKDLLGEAKVLTVAMSNDTISDDERVNAAAQIQGILTEIVDLANTQVNGEYLFAGTRTDTMPFRMDDPSQPTMVAYSGNEDVFSIKSGQTTTIPVGHDGNAVFGSPFIVVDDTNNTLDFAEDMGGGPGGELTAQIPSGRYTPQQLAQTLQVAMRDVSANHGNGIDYEVTYDADLKQFAIIDGPGANDLNDLQLLWATGTHHDTTIGADMGFVTFSDTNGVSQNGAAGVQWGVFKTLLDLKDYLEAGDVEGLQRSMTRLDTDFNHIINTIAEIGSRDIRIDIKQTVMDDLSLRYEENRSRLEDADILKAISDLQSRELAYQAALASSAKIMKLSLVDYV